jgi:DNA polymerase-3 subunit gamma/tau
MSYQVLARKWRPKTFREMVGQEHVLKALINALDHNRLHHAYLFTGTRGVGKTTIARILAKCLNCEVGVSSEPCGQCASCIEINEGRFVDLIEVDAASRTKVEDTRELLENVQYAPTRGRYKVYLIDEVHMLSTHSFNALLKTLEEPPPHVKFLLATTDPQKLPATILSRCLQFNLKNMSPERIVGHLQHVLEQEMVAFEEPALWHIGRSADGSMRDAMSLTDQAIAFGSGKLDETDVRNMLGTIDRSAVYDILSALITVQGTEVLAAVEQLSEHAPDYHGALEELLTLLHRVAIAQAVPDAVDNSQGDQERIQQFAQQLTAEDVQLYYQLALNGRRDLPLAPDPRSGFEMVLLRMLAFKPSGIPERPQRQLAPQDGVMEAPLAVKKPETPPPAIAARSPVSNPKVAKPPPVAMASQLAVSEARQLLNGDAAQTPATGNLAITNQPTEESTVQAVKTAVVDTLERVSHAAAVEGSEPVAAVVTEQAVLKLASFQPEHWLSQFERLGFGGVVGNIASHCVLEKLEAGQFYLTLDESNATLLNDSHKQRIQQHLSDLFAEAVLINMQVGPVSSETPAARRQRLTAERLQQAKNTIQQDENVVAMIEVFSARLDMDSIKPVNNG